MVPNYRLGLKLNQLNYMDLCIIHTYMMHASNSRKKITCPDQMKISLHISGTKLKCGNKNQSVIMHRSTCNIYAGWRVN